MTTGEAVGVALVLAALIIACFGKPVVTAVSGFISKGRDGRIAMTVWPGRKKSKGKRRKKRR